MCVQTAAAGTSLALIKDPIEQRIAHFKKQLIDLKPLKLQAQKAPKAVAKEEKRLKGPSMLQSESKRPRDTKCKSCIRGKALAVLAEMVDGKWAFLEAQAASECRDPVDYKLIGDSSHNFTELLAAAWAAL